MADLVRWKALTATLCAVMTLHLVTGYEECTASCSDEFVRGCVHFQSSSRDWIERTKNKQATYTEVFQKCMAQIQRGDERLKMKGCERDCTPTAEMNEVLKAGYAGWDEDGTLPENDALGWAVVVAVCAIGIFACLSGGRQTAAEEPEEDWEDAAVTESKAEIEARDWNQLSTPQRLGAVAAGYDEQRWQNDAEPATSQKAWADLTRRQRNGLLQLAETRAMWDAD